MRYHKTSRAREALAGQDQSLSQAERRILILCDGRRDARQVIDMLGADTAASLQLLHQQGFLTVPADAPAASPGSPRGGLDGLGGSLGRLWQRRADTGPADRNQRPPAPATTQAAGRAPAPADVPPAMPAPARNNRRSMAACKMYLLDMLQLQRSVEASALAVDIQTSAGDDELVTRMLEALQWLHGATKPGMFQRMAERLAETLPEPHLPRLQAACAGIQARQAAATSDNVVPLNVSTASRA